METGIYWGWFNSRFTIKTIFNVTLENTEMIKRNNQGLAMSVWLGLIRQVYLPRPFQMCHMNKERLLLRTPKMLLLVLQTLTAPEIVTALNTWSSHLSTRSLFNPVVMAQATPFPSVLCNKGAENHLSNE